MAGIDAIKRTSGCCVEPVESNNKYQDVLVSRSNAILAPAGRA
ncbi:hypothetical protein SAMN05444745_1296 [Arthrobacter sp. OV608]|nr:hypothetical protein SAMN05444745_1296 [Arthrobacter sp. OV608]